jgi:hypothetical protein
MRNGVRTLALLIALQPAWIGASQAVSRNHLSRQSSAYLSRAAGQPVDWYPWGAEAFKRAKQLDRPILLDVGAVWCPWCGLMDRDICTNPETADYINQHFVAVKVDFDASPKLVAQLQRAQAVLNFPAGLPLTSFITPDGKLYCSILVQAACPWKAAETNNRSKTRQNRLLRNTQTRDRSTKNRSNWRLRSDQEKHIPTWICVALARDTNAVWD